MDQAQVRRTLASNSKGTSQSPCNFIAIAAVWWFAPFFSGGGYSSEAIDVVLALHASPAFRTDSIWATQHGDGIQRGVLQVLTASPCAGMWEQ
jgi:hypothetical protein